MKVRFVSDLHNEFNVFHVPEMEDDLNTTLVLAGDVDVQSALDRWPAFLKKCAEQFRDVVYVFGNHEYYGGSILTAKQKLLDCIEYDVHNVHVLENKHIVIDDVCFIGATMWADFENGNPLVIHDARQFMNDYHRIRVGPKEEPWQRKLSPLETLAMHRQSRKYIFETIYEQKLLGRKVIVVTHHSPSWMGVAECFRSSALNGCYHSNLEEEVISSNPNLWIHGHTHVSLDYILGETRVLCNPRGYFGTRDQNPNFDPYKVIEL